MPDKKLSPLSGFINKHSLYCELLGVDGNLNTSLIKEGEQIPCFEISDWSRLSTEPIVSVFIITYNHELYIRETIESILSQKCSFPFELVIAEDCSTDCTREICFEYQKKYPEVIRILYSDENVGMERNGVRAWNHLRGKYIACCEGDDYWVCDTKLQEQVDFLEQHADIDLVGSMCKGVYLSDKSEKKERGCFPAISGIIRPTLHNYTFVHFSTWMHRRSLFDVLRKYYCAVPITDTAILTLLQWLGKCAIIPKLYSVYRVTGKGVWSSLSVPERRIARLVSIQTRSAGYPANMRPFFCYEILVEYIWWANYGIRNFMLGVVLVAILRLIKYAFRFPGSILYFRENCYIYFRAGLRKLDRFIRGKPASA